jgi:hypothetical protein
LAAGGKTMNTYQIAREFDHVVNAAWQGAGKADAQKLSKKVALVLIDTIEIALSNLKQLIAEDLEIK